MSGRQIIKELNESAAKAFGDDTKIQVLQAPAFGNNSIRLLVSGERRHEVCATFRRFGKIKIENITQKYDLMGEKGEYSYCSLTVELHD